MQLLDHYTYNNRLCQVSPAPKLGLSVAILVLCLLLNKPVVGLLAVLGIAGLVVFIAGLPGRMFIKLLLAEGLFLAITVLGIAISFSFSASMRGNCVWQIGSLYLSVTPESLDNALHLFARALGGAAAMNFLALTTPLPDLLELLRRLRVPIFLLDIATITYRFIFVLLESFERIYTAQSCRLGYSNTRRAFRSAGLLGSRLFIESYQRSQRLQTALESRGYTGVLKVLPLEYQRNCVFNWAAVALLTCLLIVGVLF